MRAAVVASLLVLASGCKGAKEECKKAADHALSLMSEAPHSDVAARACARRPIEAIECELNAATYAQAHVCPVGDLAPESEEPTAEKIALCERLGEHRASLLAQQVEPRHKEFYERCLELGAKYARCVRGVESHEDIGACAEKHAKKKE